MHSCAMDAGKLSQLRTIAYDINRYLEGKVPTDDSPTVDKNLYIAAMSANAAISAAREERKRYEQFLEAQALGTLLDRE